MAIAPWLEWLTPAERRKRKKRTDERLLPCGQAQKAEELKLLKQLIPRKIDDTSLTFQLLQARACLKPEDAEATQEEREDALVKWLNSSLTQQFTVQEQATFLALADLTKDMQSLERLPTAEAVQKHADELQKDGVLRLPQIEL